MDKIFSTRIDEKIIYHIGTLARELHLPKKTVIEKAILLYAEKVDKEGELDIFEKTSGTWKRGDTTEDIIKKNRSEFRNSRMEQ